MKRIVALLIGWSFFGIVMAEAQSMDYQARFLLHGQVFRSNTGLAGWIIVPDATQQPDPRLLVLGGMVSKSQRQWIEFLAGGVWQKGKDFEPIADIRFSRNLSPTMSLFSEVYYSHHTDQLLAQSSITHALKITSGRILIGAEAETLFKPDGNILGLGPRLILRIPNTKKSSLAVAYQRRTEGQDILRSYLLLQF